MKNIRMFIKTKNHKASVTHRKIKVFPLPKPKVSIAKRKIIVIPLAKRH
ncbi:MAG TPA: hypothetical protein PLI45_00510 [Candidatus Woesebacteria bacterium]|nr:hypothetical protein [Candidatus Woesebacteria bacterium]